MQVYDHTHWEELIGVIIDRIGIGRFIETVAYVTEQKGFKQVSQQIGRLEALAAAEQKAIVE